MEAPSTFIYLLNPVFKIKKMKRFFLVMHFLACVVNGMAQKAVLDTTALDKWPFLDRPSVNDNGQYVLYKINNAYDLNLGKAKMVIQSLHTSWKLKLDIISFGEAQFAEGGRLVVFQKSDDTLGIVTLGQSEINYIPNVSTFKLPENGNRQFLVYQLKEENNPLILFNLRTGTRSVFSGVKHYNLQNSGKILLLLSGSNELSVKREVMQWIDLATLKKTQIWQSVEVKEQHPVIEDICFDEAGTQLAFIVSQQGRRTIWYYKNDADSAKLLVDDHSAIIPSGYQINRIGNFSTYGSKLFCSLSRPVSRKQNKGIVKVDIWSYKDTKLQSLQEEELNEFKTYLAVINLRDHKIVQLEQKKEELPVFVPHGINNEKFIPIRSVTGDMYESYWNNVSRETIYLVSVESGERKEVVSGPSRSIRCYGVSPQGRFLLYYSGEKKGYFTYEIATGITRNITHDVTTSWTAYDYNDEPDSAYLLLSQPIWTNDDTRLIIGDQFDLWELDPAGRKAARNITNFYGRNNKIYFRVSQEGTVLKPKQDILLLDAFNRDNKDNGFYQISLKENKGPIKLTMGPYIYNINIASFYPMKASKSDVYIVRRMRADTAPNYFWTKDFRYFQPISDLYPERNYNWLTTELHSFKTLDGKVTQGILYKPENFDPQKKYPIIFHFYERLTDRLNEFIRPELSQGDINIPWFVSRGYLVFTPDIYFEVGAPGESICNTILGAVDHLSHYTWADTTRMGIQGHSFGGYEVNYLVTHTNRFKAAISAAGASDIVAFYGSGNQHGRSMQYYERYQGRIGASLWEKRESYLANSPILFANNVTTPLLLMSNKEDHWGLYAHGIEMFTALRRLKKKVWMLQYDNEGHSLGSKEAQADFSIRMTQFFDFYLQNMPAPRWLTNGVEAIDKSSDPGLDFDMSGHQP